MNKTLIAAAAAFFALTTLLGTGAEAGFNVGLAAPAGFSILEKAGCGGGGYFHRHYHRSAHRSVRPRVEIARKPAASSVSVAQIETKPEATSEAVVSENSSISTANAKVAEATSIETPKPEVKKVAAAKDVGCKQFFPSVGMTLSVSCE